MKGLKKVIVIAAILSFVVSLSSCRSSKSGCPNNFSIEQSIN